MSFLSETIFWLGSFGLIAGLKFLSNPKTARRGNRLAGLGMLLGVGLALILVPAKVSISKTVCIFGTVFLGSLIGWVSARKVKMTSMPQMVALFNGLGGAAAAIVAGADLLNRPFEIPTAMRALVVLGIVIGSLSFSASLTAFGKLQGWIRERPLTYLLQRFSNILLFVVNLSLAGWLVYEMNPAKVWLLSLLSFLLGMAMVLPIGGADMPVVISLMNSFTGLAVAGDGFLLENEAMIIAGTIVGASGTLLTVLMCRAMNRSLANVLFGAFGKIDVVSSNGQMPDKTFRSTTPEDAASLLSFSRQVVIVPGYGLAVAQAQQAVRELTELLENRSVEVKFAIHPVAGRMPGHMNVLLAEANIPYEKLTDLDQINPEFPETDVVLVIGANDVVNPAARHDKISPIYGMPILDVDRAKNVIVIKRSMNPGFAGIDNELFYHTNTLMLFGDAKSVIIKLVQAVKNM